MQLKLKQPCGILTLPDGKTVDVERLGKGRFTTAWRSGETVYLRVHEDDHSKEILSHCSPAPHIPACTFLEDESVTSGAPFRWFKMPLYFPLTAKSKEAWKQFRILQKIHSDCWIQVCNNASRQSRDDDANRMRQLVADRLEESDSLPASLREAIIDIINESYNYGDYSLEFTKKNLAVDRNGTLILLDPVFDLSYIRNEIRERQKRARHF